jgi:hypothetical protein
MATASNGEPHDGGDEQHGDGDGRRYGTPTTRESTDARTGWHAEHDAITATPALVVVDRVAARNGTRRTR